VLFIKYYPKIYLVEGQTCHFRVKFPNSGKNPFDFIIRYWLLLFPFESLDYDFYKKEHFLLSIFLKIWKNIIFYITCKIWIFYDKKSEQILNYEKKSKNMNTLQKNHDFFKKNHEHFQNHEPIF
jgi:hypothetical protein